MRVLYVEDEAPVRDALMRAFRWSAPDLICDVAGDLDQALAKLEPAPDRMLLDLCLGAPGNSDGLAVLLEARARGIGAPAIVLSGTLEFWSAADAQDLGAIVVPKAALDPAKLALRLAAPARAFDCTGFSKRPEYYRELASRLALLEGTLHDKLEALAAASVELALEANGGSKAAAARELGLPRRVIQRRRNGR